MRKKKKKSFKQMKEMVDSYKEKNKYKEALVEMGVKSVDEITLKRWEIADEILKGNGKTDEFSQKREQELIKEIIKLGESKWK